MWGIKIEIHSLILPNLNFSVSKMRRDNNSLLFISGVILGAVVGGAMGVLFAPASGEETRDKIAKKSKKVMKEVKKGAQELGEKIEPALENVKKEFAERVEEMKAGFEKGAKAVKK